MSSYVINSKRASYDNVFSPANLSKLEYYRKIRDSPDPSPDTTPNGSPVIKPIELPKIFTLYNSKGYEILGADIIYEYKAKLNTEQLSGLCSILSLFSESQRKSYMIIRNNELGYTVDPKIFCKTNYLYSMNIQNSDYAKNESVISDKHYVCIIKHLTTYSWYQYDTTDFIDGIRLACLILNRSFNDIIIENYSNWRRKKDMRRRNSTVDIGTRLDMIDTVPERKMSKSA